MIRDRSRFADGSTRTVMTAIRLARHAFGPVKRDLPWCGWNWTFTSTALSARISMGRDWRGTSIHLQIKRAHEWKRVKFEEEHRAA